mgnify:CR=1 FL=1
MHGAPPRPAKARLIRGRASLWRAVIARVPDDWRPFRNYLERKVEGAEPDHVDAVYANHLPQLLKPQVDVAAGHERGDGNAGRCSYQSILHAAGDAPAVEKTQDVRAARPGRVADGAGGQYRLLHRVG